MTNTASARPHRKRFGKDLFFVFGVILLGLYTISFLVPLLWALMSSFKSETEFMLGAFKFPINPSFDNYVTAYMNISVPLRVGVGSIFIEEMFVNTLIYAGLCTLMHTLTPCIAAYAAAKYDFKFSRIMYGIVIVTMILPVIGNTASELQMSRILHFYDSFVGLAIMRGHFLGTNFLIYYASFRSLANDFADAARVDGASQWCVMTRIMIPLVKPTIAAIALISFITYWNDYMTAMLYLPSHPTISYGLYYFTHSSSNQSSFFTVQIAGCMLICIPILLVFILFKNKLMGNMAIGGIKG